MGRQTTKNGKFNDQWYSKYVMSIAEPDTYFFLKAALEKKLYIPQVQQNVSQNTYQ